jgi:iron-sulfur cluster assembly protein
MPINVTPAAIEAIKKQLLKRGTLDAYLRVGVRGGGCSGFTYFLQYQDEPPHERDTFLDLEGVKILIDSKSILYLQGTTLDWESTMVKSGFKFINPNETSQCGCGSSFSI